MSGPCTTGGDHTLSLVEDMPDGGQCYECTTCGGQVYVDRHGRRWVRAARMCEGTSDPVPDTTQVADDTTAVCDRCGQRVDTRPHGDDGYRYFAFHLATAPEQGTAA